MTGRLKTRIAASMLGAVALAGVAIGVANAQNAPAPSPTKVAIENRRAAYTLIGNSFRWFGAVVKGTVPYDAAEAKKRAERISHLAAIPSENFPEGSNAPEPDSKAKAEVWSNRADFDKKQKEFVEHAAAFAQAISATSAADDGFKAAVASLGQDCKGCHDTYKAK